MTGNKIALRSALVIAALAALAGFWGCAGVSTTAGGGDIYGEDIPRPGGVEGVLSDEEGAPLSGAIAYFYTDKEKRFRGPADYMAEPAGEDGRYVTELPEGEYYVVARKRMTGEISGNVQKGDYQTKDAFGPVEVVQGEYARADLTLVELTGNMLFNIFVGKGSGQGVRGTITGRDGAPVERAYAFAYKDPKMVGKPDYVSEWTHADGVYVIYVDDPGVYYVGARTGYMGVPRPDEPYGRYGAARDHSVRVEEGEFFDGADVTLKRFSDFR